LGGIRLIRLLLVGGGAAALLLLTAVNAPGPPVSPHEQFALLAGGVLLLALGFSLSAGERHLPRWQGPLLAALLLAAALRLWHLETAVHFYVDEGHFVEAVLQLRAAEPDIRLLGPFSYIAAFTWTYPYLQWAAAEVVGSNLLALRLISAACGVLTVAAVGRLGRELFGARVGLLAALLLAVFPPHLHFSRLGLNNIADPLFGTLALALLARGLRRGGWADYALAGLCLGLTQYFYEGGRLLYPALALIWGGGLALRRRHLAGFGTLLAAAVGVALPVYATLLAWDITLTTRLERRGFDAAYWRRVLLEPGGGALGAHLREHVLPPFLHYISRPDASAFYYGGHTALLLPHLLPVGLVGWIAGWRRGRAGVVLLALWLILVALGNSLIRDSVWTARYVAAFPALALLLALGLDALLRGLDAQVRRRGWWGGVLVALVLLSQAAYYFGPHLRAYQTQIRPHHDQQDVVFRLRDLPPETRVYWITDDPDIWLPLLVFLTRYWGLPDFAPELRRPDALAADALPDRLEPGVPYAFFVEADDLPTQALIQARYGPAALQFSPYPVPPEKQYGLMVYRP
jgi:hypothetical protein